MSHRNFFIQIGLVSIGTVGLLFFLHQSEHFQAYSTFSYASLIGFILLSIGMYFLSLRAAKSRDKNLFLQQVLATTFMKMLLCIVIIVGYFKFAEPPSKMYAIPFLIIYLIFTIFETYFMMKLSNVKPDHEKK